MEYKMCNVERGSKQCANTTSFNTISGSTTVAALPTYRQCATAALRQPTNLKAFVTLFLYCFKKILYYCMSLTIDMEYRQNIDKKFVDR